MKPNFSPYYIFEEFPQDLNSSKGIVTFFPLTTQGLIYKLKDSNFESFIKTPALIKKIKDQVGIDVTLSEGDSYELYNRTNFILIRDCEERLKIFFCAIESNKKGLSDLCHFF